MQDWKMKINKRAEIGDILIDNAVYLVLAILFFSGMLWFILSYNNGAVFFEDYYVKEIVKIIDFSRAGDSVCLDVHRATEIGKKNDVASFSEIFQIDNFNNEVCVKLSRGRRSCYNYFNDVDIVGIDLKLSEGKNEKGESVLNIFCFDIVERQRKEELA